MTRPRAAWASIPCCCARAPGSHRLVQNRVHGPTDHFALRLLWLEPGGGPRLCPGGRGSRARARSAGDPPGLRRRLGRTDGRCCRRGSRCRRRCARRHHRGPHGARGRPGWPPRLGRRSHHARAQGPYGRRFRRVRDAARGVRHPRRVLRGRDMDPARDPREALRRAGRQRLLRRAEGDARHHDAPRLRI